jgi:hypothetical protein
MLAARKALLRRLTVDKSQLHQIAAAVLFPLETGSCTDMVALVNKLIHRIC